MNTYAPLWSLIVESSVWSEPYFVRVLFTTMLAIKDADHVVRYTAFSLARRANMTEAEVLEGLRVLSSPDTKRLEPQAYEGRRIQKVEDGWLVLNGEKYREMMRKANNREYQRQWQAQYREKQKSGGAGEKPKKSRNAGKPLPGEQKYVEDFEAGRVDANGQPAPEHGPVAQGPVAEATGQLLEPVPRGVIKGRKL